MEVRVGAGRAVGFWKSAAIVALMASTALTASLAGSGIAWAQAAAQTSFNIPAGPLAQALAAFGKQSGLQVTYPSELTVGKQSPGMTGPATPEQALSKILSGSGLSYSFANATTVAISGPGTDAGATVEGAIALDTIDVSGGGTAAEAAADAPYQTPGSTSYVSRETLDRVPPISPGDVFITTPGVINAGNRVGTSINPNIRGLQGMGRVNVTIDGARQATSTYRGYIGNRDESYIDPDMVGGIDIIEGAERRRRRRRHRRQRQLPHAWMHATSSRTARPKARV